MVPLFFLFLKETPYLIKIYLLRYFHILTNKHGCMPLAAKISTEPSLRFSITDV